MFQPPKEINHQVLDEFNVYWNRQLLSSSPDLSSAIFDFVKRDMFSIALFKFIADVATISPPLVLVFLLKYISNPNSSLAEGFIYVILMFALAIISSLCLQNVFQNSQRIGIKIQTCLSLLIYRKCLVLSSSARQNFNPGKVVNMISTDANKAQLFWNLAVIIVTAPIQIFMIIGLMIWSIGPSALAGVGLLIFLTPVQGLLFRKLSLIRKTVAKITDDRVSITQEVLSGIRIIKFFSWETSFQDKITKIRQLELSQIFTRAVLNAIVVSIIFAIPTFCSTLSFTLYSLFQTLDASQIFPTLAWFGILRFPLM